MPLRHRRHFVAAGCHAAGPRREIKNIVMVHGAWADGSGWRPIYEILKADGYNVRMVQNPLTSLAADVAATDRVLDRWMARRSSSAIPMAAR